MSKRHIIDHWLIFLFIANLSLAQSVPERVNYQGRLVENGSLVNRSVTIISRFYDHPTGGSVLLQDEQVVTVVDGLYSVLIGKNITQGSFDLVSVSTSVYVQLQVDGQLLWPREQMASSLNALNSRSAAFATLSASSSNALALQGFGVSTQVPTMGQLLTFDGTNWTPQDQGQGGWATASNSYYTKTEADQRFATGMPLYVESDPVFVSHVSYSISSNDLLRWNQSVSWGDHSTNGYLKAAENLADLQDPGLARSNLGLGTLSTQNMNQVQIEGGTIRSVDLNVQSNAFRVGVSQLVVSSNRVGVGTANPQSALDVVGADDPGTYVFKIYSGTNVVAWGRKKP